MPAVARIHCNAAPQILGTNYHKELRSLIAPDNLHRDYGGTSTGRLCDNIGPWQEVGRMHARVCVSHTVCVCACVCGGTTLGRGRRCGAGR